MKELNHDVLSTNTQGVNYVYLALHGRMLLCTEICPDGHCTVEYYLAHSYVPAIKNNTQQFLVRKQESFILLLQYLVVEI